MLLLKLDETILNCQRAQIFADEAAKKKRCKAMKRLRQRNRSAENKSKNNNSATKNDIEKQEEEKHDDDEIANDDVITNNQVDMDL